jgi:hypothetical protein
MRFMVSINLKRTAMAFNMKIIQGWDETGLFRLNIDTKASNSVSITSQGGMVYHSLISN